jgi:3'-phosphoadenosine 5'-phosphosulfate sulfotransferase (PAPS reductase)/FAD synthetase
MRPTPAVLKALEEESIEILRETAATFSNPVMLYSIGKDSSVLLHLAKKAFYPAEIPFTLLHIDTTWKFKEMISFRDEIVKKYGVKLIVHTNQQVVRAEMKRKVAQKREFLAFERVVIVGNLVRNDLNYGELTTPIWRLDKQCAYFLFLTGRKLMFGNISTKIILI